MEHFQQCSLESCFGEQVRTTLLHPYGTAVEQMRGTLAVAVLYVSFESNCIAKHSY